LQDLVAFEAFQAVLAGAAGTRGNGGIVVHFDFGQSGSGDFAGKTAVRGFGDRSEFNESPAELGNTVSRTGEAGDRYPRHGDVGDSVRVLCGHLVEGPLVQSAHMERVFIESGIDEERRSADVKNL